MVRAFGSFVVGVEGSEGLVIGFIMFIILVAVQAFVITKGATRVSEVAARFTLDAMGPKQMAVEAEYNSGAITEEESRRRKQEIQKEADFYGAMDGASKFVSNNVKLGIFITVINLVGGLIIGMVFHKEPFSQAIGTYATLTIGDGLLAQLPSLFISIATGILVTRSVSDGTFGGDVQSQFSRNAWVYFVGAGTLLVIAFLPKFPWYILIPIAAGLAYVGFRLQRTEKAHLAHIAVDFGLRAFHRLIVRHEVVDVTDVLPVALRPFPVFCRHRILVPDELADVSRHHVVAVLVTDVGHTVRQNAIECGGVCLQVVRGSPERFVVQVLGRSFQECVVTSRQGESPGNQAI